MKSRVALCAFILGTLLASPARAQGQSVRAYSKEKLPEYCNYTRDGQMLIPGRKEYYQKLFAGDWSHLHHYCRGQYKMNSVLQALDGDYLNPRIDQVIEEFDYVLKAAELTFPLRPEILVNKARMLLLRERPREAEEALIEAIALKGDYLPAYVALSNHHRSNGDVQAAVAILEVGLRNVPGSKLLSRKLAQLDNKVTTQ